MVLCRAIDPSQRLYLMSHHFIWLSPLSNLAFFMVIGLVLAVAIKLAPRATGWFGPRLICACTILPVLIAAEPRTYTSAWLLVSLGVAVCLVPIFGRYRTALRTWLTWSFPFMLGLVFVLAGFVFGARIGSSVRASQAARCRRAIRRTSFSSCLTRCGQTVLAFTVTSAHRLPISSDSRSEEFASTMPAQQHPGRWLRTRACSPVTGRTKSVHSG